MWQRLVLLGERAHSREHPPQFLLGCWNPPYRTTGDRKAIFTGSTGSTRESCPALHALLASGAAAGAKLGSLVGAVPVDVLTVTCRSLPQRPDCIEVGAPSPSAEFTLAGVLILLGTRAAVELFTLHSATVELSQPLAWPLRYRRSPACHPVLTDPRPQAAE